ncbi:MAG TPA: hypothetical protein VFP58_06415 [Candidatus Eisenbacteria bacterium]|nr:hypothetical protein [Candidatus Eisenbacteria bacterium]
MNRWSEYLNSKGAQVGLWLMSGSAAAQALLLAEEWNAELWVLLALCGVPIGLISFARRTGTLAMAQNIAATAHLLLTALALYSVVRPDRPQPSEMLLLLLLPGAVYAVGTFFRTRSRPKDQPGDSSAADQRPIE